MIQGEEYQDFIQHELYKEGLILLFNSSAKYQLSEGEGITHVEIKYDRKVKGTGNVFIETMAEDKTKTSFIPGGIFKNDNCWLYIIGDYNRAWMFCKTQLQAMWEKDRGKYIKYGYIKPMDCKDDTGHVFAKGFLITKKMLDNSALVLRKFEFANKEVRK